MRISDWSSDVCSSYLLKPSPSRGGFGWGWVSPTPPQIKSRRGRSPDLRQGFDGFAITQRDGVAVAVVAVDDHAVAADHHFAPQVPVAAEDPAVKSEQHTSEHQSLMRISYAVLCLIQQNV